jgi:hypothetical protein
MFRKTVVIGFLCAFTQGFAVAQLAIANGEGQSIKFGFQGQLWVDSQQAMSAGGGETYQQNFYLRRVRLLVSGDLWNDLTFFLQTDQPNLGKSPKVLNSGFLVQDAFLEYKLSNAFRLDGGLMLVPLSRNTLQSTLSYYSLDISPISTVNNTSTQSSGLRDLGFQARGFVGNDRLQYRLGVFDGARNGTSGNSLRTAGYIQYDFLDREKGYTFVGTALGKQKILAVDCGFDTQGTYRAWSGNVAASIPVRHGDEIGGQLQYIHYDGRTLFTAIPKQNDYLAEASWYRKALHTQPFVKFEKESFASALNLAKDYNKWGGGASYYVHGQNLKFTAQLQRVLPSGSAKPANEMTLQLQAHYF